MENAPVCDATDYATGVEDDVAGRFCDSVWVLEGGREGRRRRGALANFG